MVSGKALWVVGKDIDAAPYIASPATVVVRSWLRSGGLLFVVGLATATVACGAARSRPSNGRVFQPAPGLRQQGMASYYASSLQGHRTASGEHYHPRKLTAAHRSLPFGTWIKVTRLDANARPTASTVVLRINDRGPFARNRIVDVSMAAARQLGMLGPGVVRVELQVVAAPAPTP